MKKKPNPKIVVVAIIEKEGNILIGKRKRGKRHTGIWEFPGGTVEQGETHEQCLLRELQEEFGVQAEIIKFICSSEYSYTADFTIQISAYLTRIISGHLELNDHDEIRWIHPADLHEYLHDGPNPYILEKLIALND